MKTGGIGTAFRLFLVLGRVKVSPPSLRSGQALACLVHVLAHGFGQPRMYLSTHGGILASVSLIQARYRDEITVRMPTSAETEKLSLPSATPVAVHMRTGYDERDRPHE